MREHTTHFMDCGCVGAERDALAAQVAKVREALESVEWGGEVWNESDEPVGACCPECGGLERERNAYGGYTAGHAATCALSAVLTSTPAASLAAYRARVVEDVIAFIEGAHYLHDGAPTAIFAREVVTGIRREFALAATPQQSGKGDRG